MGEFSVLLTSCCHRSDQRARVRGGRLGLFRALPVVSPDPTRLAGIGIAAQELGVDPDTEECRDNLARIRPEVVVIGGYMGDLRRNTAAVPFSAILRFSRLDYDRGLERFLEALDAKSLSSKRGRDHVVHQQGAAERERAERMRTSGVATAQKPAASALLYW